MSTPSRLNRFLENIRIRANDREDASRKTNGVVGTLSVSWGRLGPEPDRLDAKVATVC
jgi:hypothetical protein